MKAKNMNSSAENLAQAKPSVPAITGRNAWSLEATLGQIGKGGPPDKTGPGSNWMSHGGYSLKRKYLSGELNRSTRPGRAARALEIGFARHCGYNSLAECPVTLQLKIQIAVANRLFLSVFEVQPDSKIGARDAIAAENTLNRILTELGTKHPEKTIDLHDYLEAQGDE